MEAIREQIKKDLQVFVQGRSTLYGRTTGEMVGDGFFVREGWRPTENMVNEGDYLVPLAAITMIEEVSALTKVNVLMQLHVCLTREQVRQCPTRWMVGNGLATRKNAPSESANVQANLERLARWMGRPTQQEIIRNRIGSKLRDDEPQGEQDFLDTIGNFHRALRGQPPFPPRYTQEAFDQPETFDPEDVADLGEQAILEIRDARRRAQAFKEEYGPFSPEEEKLHQRSLERKITQIEAKYEQALADVTEVT